MVITTRPSAPSHLGMGVTLMKTIAAERVWTRKTTLFQVNF